MNKESIALAADSAVTTLGEQKIFTSANKLFSLSKFHPVGIMIYGNASFMGIPSETLIKIYRKNIESEEFNTLQEYSKNFVDFLASDKIQIPVHVQDNYVKFTIYSYFVFLNKLIKDKIDNDFNQKKTILENDVKRVISNVIQNQYDTWIKANNVPSIPKEFNQIIIDQYNDTINQGIAEIFGKLPITTKQKNLLRNVVGDIFAKFPQRPKNQNRSGIVIAGFGKDDIFPSYVAYEIDGIVNHNLKYQIFDQDSIDFDSDAVLQAFAQSDMVATFIEGVNPHYMHLQSEYLKAILNDYSSWVSII